MLADLPDLTDEQPLYKKMDLIPAEYNNKMSMIRNNQNARADPYSATLEQPMNTGPNLIQVNTPQQPYQSDPVYDITCLQISRHIKDCPVCSKLYNTDCSVYILVICLLSIVCLILLKRVLNL